MFRVTNHRGYNIVVEGPIGSGKSTECVELRNEFIERGYHLNDVIIIGEECMTTKEGQRQFSNYCEDPVTHAEEFQRFMLISRGKTDLKVQSLMEEGKVVITERSAWSDRVFGNANRENMGEVAYEAYRALEKEVLRNCAHPDAFIFLSVSPECCLDRIAGREREGEVEESGEVLIPLAYMQKLDYLYREWATRMKKTMKNTKFIEYDWSIDKNNSEGIAEITRRNITLVTQLMLLT